MSTRSEESADARTYVSMGTGEVLKDPRSSFYSKVYKRLSNVYSPVMLICVVIILVFTLRMNSVKPHPLATDFIHVLVNATDTRLDNQLLQLTSDLFDTKSTPQKLSAIDCLQTVVLATDSKEDDKRLARNLNAVDIPSSEIWIVNKDGRWW